MGNTLGELCTITKGITGIQKAIPGQYPLVVTAEDRKSHNEYQFDDEAVIVPLVSGTGHGHASINRIHYQTGKFALGSILCAIIPKDKSVLNAEYLFRFLNLNKDNELVARMRGMANVTLPIKEIAKIEIPLSCLAEQLKFVEKYKLLEQDTQSIEIEFNTQLSLVKQLRKAFLSEAMQGKLITSPSPSERAEGEAETGQQLLARTKAEKAQLIKDKKLKKEKELPPIKPEEIPFEIPEDWVWCRLGEVIEYTTNLDIQKYLPADTIINYVDIDAIDNENQTIREVKRKKVSELSTRARRVLKKGYIAYSSVRPYLKNIAIIDNELENYIGSTGLNVFKTVYVKTEFVFYFLLSPYINNRFKEMMSGFNSPSITNEQFEKTLIPIPPLSIQNQIVAKLDGLMKTCDDLENSIKQSQLQNDQLLQQVLKEALEVREEVLS